MNRDMTDLTIVILAGGKGTRIQELYPDVPKPLVPVAGKPFLHWLTLWLSHHGPKRFIFSIGHLGHQIEGFAAQGIEGLDLACIREAQPLGTGGGLLNCLTSCSDWIMVVNGDGLVIGGISELLACRSATWDGAMLGVQVSDASRFGSLLTDGRGCLSGFREKAPGAGLVNGGVYLFRKSLLEQVARPGSCSIEYDLFPDMLLKGAKISVIETDGAFIDIGTPETVREAEVFVRRHLLRY